MNIFLSESKSNNFPLKHATRDSPKVLSADYSNSSRSDCKIADLWFVLNYASVSRSNYS